MPRAAGRDSRFHELAKVLRYQMTPVCHLCGEAIDLSLDPQKHRRGWTLDHIVSLTDGGHPYAVSNLAPAHRDCNSRKAAEATNSKRRPPTSRRW